jgi:acyl-CoA synthetase (AMP-forming)/AMP-acid ligase II
MNELPADVGALVEHWRRATPDREAVRFGQRSWTWAQFAGRVERNAAAQVAAGLRPGDRVAVWDSSSPVHLETMLACLRAGTVLVPVNFRYSAEEAGYLIKDAQARLLIVGSEFRPRADSIATDLPSVARIVTSDDSQYERWLAGAGPAIGLPGSRADACFLQIYTSGTTGFPKGAMLTGANLTANAVALGPALGVSRGSVWLAGDSSAITADGWLHTGDTGYLDSGGYLYLTGRLKDMFIRGGDNVYAAEVERVLAEHPDVAEAAVIGVPDDTWGEVGLAFLVPAAGAEADVPGVLRHCREHLAEYKCPASVAIVGESAASGRQDSTRRRKLRRPRARNTAAKPTMTG